MPTPSIEVPAFQNWSCHNCAGCCRQHLIGISEEEKARIDSQKWTSDDGVLLPACLPHGKGYRLAHSSDGSCVFLDERGLCRIHAKFGEAAKPLACQIYPYAFHPAGRKVAVSLRFSCPSVVANRGTALSRQTAEIAALAARVVPAGADTIPAPVISEPPGPAWPDFVRFLRRLDQIFAQPGRPVAGRVLVALKWLELIEAAGTASLTGPDLDEVLRALAVSAAAETGSPAEPEKPSPAAMGPFRLLALQYARKDTGAHLRRIWAYRWTLMKAALRFTLGRGLIPPMQAVFKPAPFESLESPFGALPAASEETLVRFFRVKIQGIHFCGPAYYQVPFIEGFRHMALMFAATLWLARWLAAGDGRSSLAEADIAKALAVADHSHGYSPAFGAANFRRRVGMLQKSGNLPRLIAWYSR